MEVKQYSNHWCVNIFLHEKQSSSLKEQTITISDYDYKTHTIDKKSTTYESMKEVFKNKCIITENLVIINNENGYGYVKISKSYDGKNLIMEFHYYLLDQFSLPDFRNICLPASKIKVIPYTNELRKLFDFISFMK